MNSNIEIIEDIWAADLLKRRSEAEFLYSFLKQQSLKKCKTDEAFVLNIDAEWGYGKTFFLKRFAKYLRQEGHLVAEINAWKDDYTEDPFIATLSTINEVLKPYLKNPDSQIQKLWEQVKDNAAPIATRIGIGIGKTFFKKFVGEEIKDIIFESSLNEDVKEVMTAGIDDTGAEIEKLVDNTTKILIDDFLEQKRASKDFRFNLSKVIAFLKNEKQLPLFILIDELDRCRPSYAVSLLERVKHLFNIPNVVFIFATNSNQLQHAVSGAYGPSFDGFRYLKRFFDRTYTLTIQDKNNFTKALLSGLDLTKFRAPMDEIEKVIYTTVHEFNLDLREIHYFIDLIDTVSTVWNHPYTIELVSLTILSIQYIKKGICDWDSALEFIPKTATLGKISYYGDRGNHRIDDLIIYEIFDNIRNCSVSLENSIEYTNRSGDNKRQPKINYIINTFYPEWIGNSYNEKPSVLRQLPDYICSAGQISAEI